MAPRGSIQLWFVMMKAKILKAWYLFVEITYTIV